MQIHSVATISILFFLVATTTSAAAQRRPARPQPRENSSTQSTLVPITNQSPSVSQELVGAPSEATLGVPVYPSAIYLTEYDAGNGQSYYIFGVGNSYEEIVQYYKVVLDDGGNRVFSAPPVHTFPTGRFREETMAFQPSVTIKDYTWNGSAGYLNPTPGSTDRYPTIIQIVLPPIGEIER